MTQTVPDISPLMHGHQDPLLVIYLLSIKKWLPVCLILNVLNSLSTVMTLESSERTRSTQWLLFLPWWRHQIEVFPRYWPFVRGIHWSPVDSPHNGQWRGALMLSLMCAWTNGSSIKRDAVDLRRHRAHYDVTVMSVASLSTVMLLIMKNKRLLVFY